MLTYKNSGVDLNKNNEFVEIIKNLSIHTITNNVLSGIDGFNGAFTLPSGYQEPVLISSTDGVGTKTLLAKTSTQLYNIGIDLAAMIINDIICSGAKPLFFLDYYAVGHIDTKCMIPLITGLSDSLARCNVALIGGETAEMPDVYDSNKFDVVGFGIGIVEKSKMINGLNCVHEGDVILGIESSGPHSNGYSLIRKILSNNVNNMNEEEYNFVVDAIMKPTILYSPAINDVVDHVNVKGIAHITGGGLVENIPRIVDKFWKVTLDTKCWPIPKIFEWLKLYGPVPIDEMFRVFNMGIGMIVILNECDLNKTQKILEIHKLKSWKIGEVLKYNPNEKSVTLLNVKSLEFKE